MLHTIAFSLIFSRNTDFGVTFAIGIIGLLVSVILSAIIFRQRRSIEFITEKLEELEQLDNGNENKLRVKIFTDPAYLARTSSHFNLGRWIFAPAATVIISIWAEEVIRNGLKVVPIIFNATTQLLSSL